MRRCEDILGESVNRVREGKNEGKKFWTGRGLR